MDNEQMRIRSEDTTDVLIHNFVLSSVVEELCIAVLSGKGPADKCHQARFR